MGRLRARRSVRFAIVLWGAIGNCRISGVRLVRICFMGGVCLSGLGVVGLRVVRFVGIRLIMGRWGVGMVEGDGGMDIEVVRTRENESVASFACGVSSSRLTCS